MPNSTHLYRQLLDFLRQHSRASDLRHLKALAWMVSALICSGQLSLPAWEPYVQKESEKSTECGATVAALFGQCADSSDRFICAVGSGCVEWMEGLQFSGKKRPALAQHGQGYRPNS